MRGLRSRWRPGPALIRRAPALCHPRLEQPTAYFGGSRSPRWLTKHAIRRRQTRFFRGWTRRMPLETAQKIMTWMWAVGILDPLPGASRDHATSARR